MDASAGDTGMQLDMRMVQEYYSREDVQKAIIDVAKDREIAGVFRSGSFGTRPNVLVYPNDVIEMVKSGVIEFHSSLERWSNPMAIRPDNHEDLRIGWDLILDIDCKEFEHARITATVLCKALEKHGVKNHSLKYTGGKGFHIGIPWESMPDTIDYKKSVSMFPDVARHIGLYLKNHIKEDLGEAFLRKYRPEELAAQSGKPLGKILADDNVDPFRIVEIDSVLISSRHLFRMPYSLNRNTGLVSVPMSLETLRRFRKDDARPDLVKVRERFLDKGKPGEADILVAEAVDWWTMRQAAELKKIIRKAALNKPAPKELFPPCIKNIEEGLSDGRKRSVFILRNFLYSLRWGREDVEKFIIEWNQKNKPPLSDSIIRGQLRLQRSTKDFILPPNCTKEGYYESFGICKPDHICGENKNVKNPINYTLRKIDRKRPEKKTKRRITRIKPKKSNIKNLTTNSQRVK